AGRAEVLPRLLELLGDRDAGVRGAAVEALAAQAGRAEVLPRLLELLGDQDAGVRRQTSDVVLNAVEKNGVMEALIRWFSTADVFHGGELAGFLSRAVARS